MKKEHIICEAIPFDGLKEQIRIINELKRKFGRVKIEVMSSLIYCESIEVVKDI